MSGGRVVQVLSKDSKLVAQRMGATRVGRNTRYGGNNRNNQHYESDDDDHLFASRNFWGKFPLCERIAALGVQVPPAWSPLDSTPVNAEVDQVSRVLI